MVETRITNKVFFSNAIPRVPIIDSSTPPVAEPDTGSGGIGQPSGTDIIALGSVPNITRVGHTRDIFVALGATMSISYQADADCVLLPKGGYEDMVVSYSANGRTMTLTWACPNDEPADSTYIGVEVWVHGNTSATEAYAVHWDRLHVGKTNADLKYIGANTSWTNIYPGISQRSDLVAGDTVIITDATYSHLNDMIGIGYSTNSPSRFNSVFPNGVTTTVTHEGEQFRVPVKHSNIMAETPLGVFLDRQHRDGVVVIRGDNRTSPWSSGRNTYAINVSGIDALNGPYGFVMSATDSCSITYSASVVDTLNTETTLAFGGGTNTTKLANRNANYEYVLSFGNQRMLNNDGRDDSKGVWRGIFATNGCTQLNRTTDQATQTFTGYGADKQDWLNCWAIDGALYARGITVDSLGRVPYPNAAFITTNAQGHDYYGHGLLTLNTVRAGIFSDRPNPRNNFKSCVFWQKIHFNNQVGEPINLRSQLGRGEHTMENITVGKNLSPSFGDISSVQTDSRNNTFNSMLIANAIWDETRTDSVSDVTSANRFIDLYVIKPPANMNSILNSSAGFITSNLTPRQLGFHYISRIESGSILALLPVKRGCQNLFPAIGRYGKRYIQGSREVYDGTGGLPYVNKMARSPWFEFRRARKRFACVSNGLTFSGNNGIAKDGVHPVDYINRFGTDASTPENCPYIDDIYGVVDGSTVRLFWRPVCPAYRGTITSYTLLIDNVIADENISPAAIGTAVTGISLGQHIFEVVCIDPVFGNSGKSTPVTLTI